MATRREKIISKAIEILKSNADGIRYSDLVKRIHERFCEIPINTIRGTIWNLDVHVPKEVHKPARGLFQHNIFREEEIIREEKPLPEIERIKEEDFTNLLQIGLLMNWKNVLNQYH